MNATLSTRVAAGVTATYVLDLSRHSASAPRAGRVRSGERDVRHRAGRPARRGRSFTASPGRGRLASCAAGAAVARRPAS
jgi:hypothetical protein